MIFIFEDDERAMLSRLFRAAYVEQDLSNFIYARGNSNINNILDRLVKETKEKIMVFMDVIPGNAEVYDIYKMVSRTAKRYKGQVYLLPIVCSEYYFIKSVSTSCLCLEKKVTDVCVSRRHYLECIEYLSEEDRRYCKNFEKFCKLILMKFVARCVSTVSDGNPKYLAYINDKCLCSSPMEECVENSVVQKAIKFVQQFPCFPIRVTSGTSCHLMSELDIDRLRESLVQEFNDMVSRFMIADSENASKYRML